MTYFGEILYACNSLSLKQRGKGKPEVDFFVAFTLFKRPGPPFWSCSLAPRFQGPPATLSVLKSFKYNCWATLKNNTKIIKYLP